MHRSHGRRSPASCRWSRRSAGLRPSHPTCCRASGRGGEAAPGRRQARGSLSSGRHARCQWHWLAPPFCATGRAVGLDVAAVDLASLRNPAFLGQRRQDAGPDAPPTPPVPAIIDRRRRAVFWRAIRPATAALEHVDDAGDYPAIINPPRSGLDRALVHI